MDPILGATIVSGVGSLANGLLNTFTGQSQSKALMDYQYQLQQKAIDAANLYNSPKEQMKRLAEAQLNPNLVYGHGVDGNQSSAASPGIANRHGQFENPFQDLSQNYLAAKNLELQQIRTRNEAFESRARRLNLEAKTLGVLSDNKLKNATLQTNIKMAAQKLANMVQTESLIQEQRNNAVLQAQVLVDSADNLAARTKLTKQQALTEVVRRESIKKGMELTQKQIEETSHMIDFVDAGTRLRRQQGDIQQTAYDATKIYQEWKAKHPNTTLTIDIVKEILGMAGDVANIAGKFVVP